MIVKDNRPEMRAALIPDSNLKELSKRTGISYNVVRARYEDPEKLQICELRKINKAYPYGAEERINYLRRIMK